MLIDFTLKNFRIFDEEGTMVPLRPITILTGCNNAGKSSIVKALCLLKDFCQQLETDYEDGKKLHLERYKMDFSKAPNSLMGGFDLVRHHAKKSEPEKLIDQEESVVTHENFISFDLVVESSRLLQDVILHLEFGSLKWDDLNNGYLQAFAIKTLDDQVIYKAERNGNASMDFSIVKKSLLYFLYGQHAFSNWQGEINFCNAASYVIDNDNKKGIIFDESIKSIYNDLGSTALVYLLEWQVSHCHRMWHDGSSGPAWSILKKISDDSFVTNSPTLGVFSYFPCLKIFKECSKNEIRQEVNKVLDSLNEPISSLDRKIVDMFLNAFEVSEAPNLHDFISLRENTRYFVESKIFNFGHKGFAFPTTYLRMEVNSELFDESSLPKEANWTVILYAMDLINKATTNSSDDSLVSFDEINMAWHYSMENSLDDFFRSVIEEIFVNMLPGSFAYSPTTIVQPKRLYSLEENTDFTRTLNRYFEAKRLFEEEKGTGASRLQSSVELIEFKPCMFIDKWLKLLEIADHVDIKRHANGYGVTILLYESEEDKDGMLLVDKGFGVLQLFAVLLKIETAIIETAVNEKLYTYDTTGLSKDIIKCLRTYNELHPATVALEEPECHLHPSLQSKFADMIVDANKQYGIHFLIESHSEYFIRKLQLLVSQKEIDSKDISLLYVNSASRPSYLPVIMDIGLETDGTLKNEFGSGFFDESLRLSRELFKPKTDDDEEEA